MIHIGRSHFGIRAYDLRETNGIGWWRLELAPLDFLINPGIWIRDTRITPPEKHPVALSAGVRVGNYRVKLLGPQLRFDHGRPEWARRLAARLGKRS